MTALVAPSSAFGDGPIEFPLGLFAIRNIPVLHEHVSLDRRHRLVAVTGQRQTAVFVPLDLPRHLDMRTLQTQTDHIVFRLGGAFVRIQQMPQPRLLHHLLGHWDAVAAADPRDRPKEMLELLVGKHGRNTSSSREIINYAKLNDEIVLGPAEQMTADGLEKSIQALHRAVTRQTALEGAGGEYRKSLPGAAGFLFAEGRIRPPPSERIADCMRALVDFLSASSHLPLLVRLAMGSAQFLAIAPFMVGNQTVCQALVTMLLRLQGYPPVFVSQALTQAARPFQEAHQAAILRGDWEAWISHFLGALEASIDSMEYFAGCIERLSNAWRANLAGRGVNANSSAYAMLDLIAVKPVFDASWASGTLGISFVAANRMLGRLIEAGIVQMYDSVDRNRIFYAPDLLAIFGEPTVIPASPTMSWRNAS